MSELTEDDIDFSRGDKDIAFIHTEIDTSEIAKKDNPREAVLEKMKKKGFEAENVQVVGIFRNEFSLHLEEDAKIFLNDNQLWPEND